MDAREHGAARVVVLSTVFCYDDDRGLPLQPGSPTLTAAETAPAAAAEQIASLFTSLGGDSVVLRLGWTCGREEAITRQVVSAARRGWRLIDGDPGAWVAMIAEPDAARAVLRRSPSPRASTTSPTAPRSPRARSIPAAKPPWPSPAHPR